MNQKCTQCKESRALVNKHFKLCNICNTSRLDCNKSIKKQNTIKYTIDKNKLSKSKKRPLKLNAKIIADELFYKKCFDLSDHRCEECGCQLPNQFSNEDGKVIARWRYSHVIPKSIAPNLRHDIRNINHLCIVHHQQWENGNKKQMNIFEKNVRNFSNFFE